jgi:hypothetical protein
MLTSTAIKTTPPAMPTNPDKRLVARALMIMSTYIRKQKYCSVVA